MGARGFLGSIGAVLVLMVLAAPLVAAERTFQFDVPGCTA